MTSVALTTLYTAEPLLMIVAMTALLRCREHRRFPALFAYIAVRLVSSVVLYLLLQAHRLTGISERHAYSWYFYSYWLSYIAGAILIFLVIQELFRSSMEPFPGLKWLGTVSFRWVACISFVAASAALTTRSASVPRSFNTRPRLLCASAKSGSRSSARRKQASASSNRP